MKREGRSRAAQRSIGRARQRSARVNGLQAIDHLEEVLEGHERLTPLEQGRRQGVPRSTARECEVSGPRAAEIRDAAVADVHAERVRMALPKLRDDAALAGARSAATAGIRMSRSDAPGTVPVTSRPL